MLRVWDLDFLPVMVCSAFFLRVGKRRWQPSAIASSQLDQCLLKIQNLASLLESECALQDYTYLPSSEYILSISESTRYNVIAILNDLYDRLAFDGPMPQSFISPHHRSPIRGSVDAESNRDLVRRRPRSRSWLGKIWRQARRPRSRSWLGKIWRQARLAGYKLFNVYWEYVVKLCEYRSKIRGQARKLQQIIGRDMKKKNNTLICITIRSKRYNQVPHAQNVLFTSIQLNQFDIQQSNRTTKSLYSHILLLYSITTYNFGLSFCPSINPLTLSATPKE
jgi:hypothetical protein